MKDFLKFTLATVTGIILSSIVLFIVSMVTLFGIMSASDTETIVKKNSVMMLDLNGTLVERTQENPLDILSQLFSDDSNIYGLDDILSSIKKAKENENIKGIYLQASSLGTSYASLQEIRNALLDFKESGKFIIAYGDSYTQGLYYLSSVADKVLLNPKGMIEWRGIAAAPVFYKDLLQKIGVEMQIFKVGTYKSAVEPFISTEMSPANREQVTAYINSIWRQVTEGVSNSRYIPVDSLNAYADRMLMFYPAEESVKCGLAQKNNKHNERFLEIYTCNSNRYYPVKYRIIYCQHGDLVRYHVCFGYGDNSKKEFGNDARSERNVGRTHARESIGHSITIIQ